MHFHETWHEHHSTRDHPPPLYLSIAYTNNINIVVLQTSEVGVALEPLTVQS